MSEIPLSLSSGEVRAHLQNLQREYAGRLPGRLLEIRHLHEQLQDSAWDQEVAETLHRMVHGITGTAGTLGMHGVSQAARQLETQLSVMLRGGQRPGSGLWEVIGKGIAGLEEKVLSRPSAESVSAMVPLICDPASKGTEVHLVMDDHVQGQALLPTLQENGFTVHWHQDIASFRQSGVWMNAEVGTAVVMDVAFANDDPDGSMLLKELQLGRHGRMPVILAVQEDELIARLVATRAGASRTLVRPLDPTRLIDTLNDLMGRRPQQAYRVLLVDDDAMMLEVHAGILRAVGMDVLSISRPMDTFKALESFAPDVLVLDVYMPEANGPELAAALRESDAHLQLPILFLSAETDLTQQLVALNLGGDDFLVKPVQPDHLVAAVTARARRARQVESLRKRLETTLYEREREHLALDHHAIVSIANCLGQVTYANDLLCQVSGYTRSELLGTSHRLLISDVHLPGFVDDIWRTIRSGKVWHGEICGQRKNGSPYWLESTVTPFFDGAGKVYQYVTIQTDISHIKATESALRAQRDMQQVISMAAARLMAETGTQAPTAIDTALRDSGTQLGADRAYLFRFSKDGTTMTNTHAWQADGIAAMPNRVENMPIETTPWMREQFLRHGRVLIQDVEAMPPEAVTDQQLLREKGLRALAVFPLFNNHQPMGFIGYSVVRESERSDQRLWTNEEAGLLKMLADVIASALARHVAESRLRKSESRLNFLVSSSPVAIYTREAVQPFALSYVSPNVQELVGLNAVAFTGDEQQGLSMVHPDDLERVSRDLHSVLQHEAGLCEYRLRRGDGTYLWVQDQRRLVHDGTGAPMEIVGCWMDITERKQYETELAAFNHELERRVDEQTHAVVESARFARATLDALSARVVILDSEGLVLAANRAWEVFGAQDMVREGTRYADVCDSVCGPDAGPGQPLADGIRAVIQGELKQFLHEYICRREDTPRWFLCRVERFPGDGAVRAVVSHENVTEMKLAERQQLRSQRLESLGTLAGGVAHDLNNALAPVLMGMNLLKEQYPDESKLFEMIEASAQRGTHMVRQLLAFAKGAEGERVSVNPSQVVREIERLMRGSFPKNIELRIGCPEGLPAVEGDPTQLHQVLLNLCVNARDAMPGGGTLSVQLQQVDLDKFYARSIPDAAPGRYVTLRVSDTGSGIPPEILDRIFDPFFTTKSADKGTGLGLSTVLGIVKGHGGFVQVHSKPGEGTVFKVYLPAGSPEAGESASAPAAGKTGGVQGHGETVLFVDDESAVREVGRAVLERLQYKALVATDGADGLVLAADHRKTLSAVITDLQMPHMDGLAFVRALRRTLPDIPVILASGRVEESVWAELQSLGVDHRLDKPFTQEQLARTLGQALAD